MTGSDDPTPREVEAELRRQAHLASRRLLPSCLDEFQVAGFVDGALEGAERLNAIEHLAGCARCRALVDATASLVADDLVMRELPVANGKRRWPRVTGAIAAAAAIVAFAVFKISGAPDDPRLRELTIASTIAPSALTPRDSVARVESLMWTSVPGAYRYNVRVQRPDGSLVWSARSVDTLLRVPDSVRLQPGVRYSWKVEAQTELNRAVGSELTPFIIGTSRP